MEGGGDKTLRTIGERTILERIVERFGPQCGTLVINANGDAARFSRYRLPVVADTVPDFAGPLAGILAVLDHAAAILPQVTDVVSVAADTPFLPRDLVARLVSARDSADAELACAQSGGRSHPVVGLWPVRIRVELRQALVEEDERKIGRFTARYRLAEVEWPSEPLDPFFNVNSPDDLERAETLLRRVPD